MWSYRLPAPETVERVEVEDDTTLLSEDEVRLRFRAGGLCGSDMPRLKGTRRPVFRVDTAPLHELVAEVVESRSSRLKTGQRVVGTLGRGGALSELLVAPASMFIAAPGHLSDTEAVTIQSIGTVVRAASTFPSAEGRRAAVIGAGPCGLAFCHILRGRGAADVTAIDPVERTTTAMGFGAHHVVRSTSAQWLATLDPVDRPDLVIEAAGHQQDTVRDAVQAVAERGFVYGFGEPDDADYMVPYEQLYLKAATLASGRTVGRWPEVLEKGAQYLEAHLAAFASYVSHIMPVTEAQTAYSLYAQPQVGRLKVVLVEQ